MSDDALAAVAGTRLPLLARPDRLGWMSGVEDDEGDRPLAERAASDPEAFTELYRRHVRRIHAFAYRRCGSQLVAEEVTAATFERAWAAMPGFRWQGGGFSAWIHRIAAAELVAYYRRAGRDIRPRAQHAFQTLAPGVEDPTADIGGDAIDVRAAMAGLPDKYQQAISLRYLAGLSHEEAAAAMGCSKPAMAVTLHRAMNALRKVLEARS